MRTGSDTTKTVARTTRVPCRPTSCVCLMSTRRHRRAQQPQRFEFGMLHIHRTVAAHVPIRAYAISSAAGSPGASRTRGRCRVLHSSRLAHVGPPSDVMPWAERHGGWQEEPVGCRASRRSAAGCARRTDARRLEAGTLAHCNMRGDATMPGRTLSASDAGTAAACVSPGRAASVCRLPMGSVPYTLAA